VANQGVNGMNVASSIEFKNTKQRSAAQIDIVLTRKQFHDKVINNNKAITDENNIELGGRQL